jgi:hypothetical protein
MSIKSYIVGLVSAAVIVPASAWAQTPPSRSLNARLLVSALDGDVIDIVGGSKSEGAPLDASPRNTAIGSPDQLWVLVEEGAPPGYFYIQSILNGYVIDINSSNFLEMNPMSSITPSQWWKQVPDPAGSGNYFIQNISNQAVIDIYGYSETPGAPLDAYQMKSPGYSGNQLWQLPFVSLLDVDYAPSCTINTGGSCQDYDETNGFWVQVEPNKGVGLCPSGCNYQCSAQTSCAFSTYY